MTAPKVGIDLKRLRETIVQCLLQVQASDRSRLPKVLQEDNIRWFAQLNTQYMILEFVDDEEIQRLGALSEKKFAQFPGLLKPKGTEMSAAFRFEKMKNVFVQGCTVNNMFSFSLGKDTTVIVQDHKQQFKTPELGDYEYVINLAYLISWGDEINRDTLYATVEDLMKSSFRKWGIKNV